MIEAGVFHNDVISVGNRNLFLYHEKAFVNTPYVISQLQQRSPLQTICVRENQVSVKEAIKTYLFNGQIVTLPSGEDLLVLPEECRPLNLDWLPLKKLFIDLTESMRNGGGPACLRFRCVMNQQELRAVHPSIFLNDSLFSQLKKWIETYYREQLSWTDLQDPALLHEVHEALTALGDIFQLPTLKRKCS